jgi:hypothetical protein
MGCAADAPRHERGNRNRNDFNAGDSPGGTVSLPLRKDAAAP